MLSVAVTCTVTRLAVLTVGVPPITPVAAPMVMPVGNPVADQVYVPLPPVAVAVVLGNTEWAVPSGN